MAKGLEAHRERQSEIGTFGKAVSKRAGFCCEWCEGRDELQLWDYRPEQTPTEEGLALLCGRCRTLADGHQAPELELHSLRSALWSPVPAVAEGVARVLARCRTPWVREAIEESLIDEELKRRLLDGSARASRGTRSG